MNNNNWVQEENLPWRMTMTEMKVMLWCEYHDDRESNVGMMMVVVAVPEEHQPRD